MTFAEFYLKMQSYVRSQDGEYDRMRRLVQAVLSSTTGLIKHVPSLKEIFPLSYESITEAVKMTKMDFQQFKIAHDNATIIKKYGSNC